MNRLVGNATVPQCCDSQPLKPGQIARKRESRRRELRLALGCLAERNASE
jgi:hypothetical protein